MPVHATVGRLLAIVLTLLFSVPAQASQPLTKYTWADTLDLPKVRNLIRETFEARKRDPKSLEITDRLLRLCSYAWRLEKDNNKQRMEYSKCLYQVGVETIELFPNEPMGHLGAAMGLGAMALIRGILPSLQHVPQGKKYLEKSIELDPKFNCSLAVTLIGRAYAVVPPFPMSIGDAKKAAENLKKALQLCPNNALAVLSLADLLWSLDRDEEALAMVERIKSIKPESEYEYFLAEVCKKKAIELAELIRSGADRDPFYDILSDSKPGLGLH